MNQLRLEAIDQIPAPERPERWDHAVVARYIYDLLRGLV
jgi:hypothetical protein